VASCEGHMWIVLRVFTYEKNHNELKVVFDTLKRNFDKMDWTSHNWEQFYLDVKGEVMSYDQPLAHGNSVQINLFCYTAHASCHMTRRSATGIILFINGAPIIRYSKCQNTRTPLNQAPSVVSLWH
jgi:hypothetical protein